MTAASRPATSLLKRWPLSCNPRGLRLLIPGLIAIALMLMPIAAQCRMTGQTTTKLFGHDVTIRSFVKQVGERILETDVLLVDGKALLRDRQVYIQRSGEFDGTRFVVGMHTFGAMCDNNFFVLVFRADGSPFISNGKVQGCDIVYRIEKDHIIFETASNPAGDDQTLRSRWIWTTNGFGPEQRFKKDAEAPTASERPPRPAPP